MKIAFLVLAAVGALLAFVGCDTTSPPKTGRVHGRIIAGAKARPDTGTVQVSLFAAWDSSKGLATEAAGGPPSFASQYIAPGVIEYIIDNISFGTYNALAASWRDTTLTGAAATTTIGAYGANPQAGDNTPLPIVFSESQPDLEIDIPVDYSRAKVSTGPAGSISGTLTLVGTWPMKSVYVVILPSDRLGPSPGFAAMGQPVVMLGIPQFSGTKTFTVPNVPYAQSYAVAAYTFTPPMTLGFIGAYGVDLPTDTTIEPVVVGGTGAVDVKNINFTIRP
jgi:hypothetical protein